MSLIDPDDPEYEEPDELLAEHEARHDSFGEVRAAMSDARRHVWERVEPSQCPECRGDPGRFLSHVFALAYDMRTGLHDLPGARGNEVDGYTLLGSIHAAIQVMHQQAAPHYDAAGNAGPERDLPLGAEAERKLGELMAHRASGDWSGDGWNWWNSQRRNAGDAATLLLEAFEDSYRPSPTRSRSGQVYLLGAGFSRACSEAMPTMPVVLETLQRVASQQRWALVDKFGLDGASDVEAWLDSLAAPMPYRSEVENAEATALFQRVAKWLAQHLASTEAQAFQTGFPDLLVDLIAHWQANRSTVITLNYDTIIERCVEKHSDAIGVEGGPLAANKIRAVPLSPTTAYMGVARAGRRTRPDGFRLSKLHGSIDWQYPGGSGRGLPIYAVDTDGNDRSRQGLAQMVPYVIPPCFTKMPLFDHEIIRQNWLIARQGLERAKELIVMGYSLPPSDTAVVHMLKTNAPQNITVLDTSRCLRERYEKLNGATVRTPKSDDPIWKWTAKTTPRP